GPDPHEGIDLPALRRRAAQAALTSGDFRRAVELARSAVEGLPPDSDERIRGDHWRLLGQALLEVGDAPRARQAVEEAVRILSDGPSVELAAALALLARMAMAGGAPEGPVHAEQARQVARTVGALAIEADATNTLAVLRHMYGDPSASVSLLREALQLSREVGNISVILRAQNNLASLLDELEGRTREALEIARDGMELAARAGLERTRGSQLATTIADLSFRLGEWDAVEALAGPAIAPAMRGGFTVGPLIQLARVRLGRGDLEDAERWLSHVRTVGAGSLFP